MSKRMFKRQSLYHLKHTFGLDAYRPGQKAAVHALLSGRDVLCVLPTGAGKSLCWQIPALVHPGVTVVVSPLIALMHDQVRRLQSMRLPAASLDSLMEDVEKERVLADIRSGNVQIVFVSPERLEQPTFRRLCQAVQPWMIVVDEAHCVIQWGDSFRPAYDGISAFIRLLPQRPVICALTATADQAMQTAIAASLRMERVRRIILPIIRENLVYSVRTTLNRTAVILRLHQDDPCRTVIFCRSRLRCEALSSVLLQAGVNAGYYHAGMSRGARQDAQWRFQAGITEVLCATTAFGMGVDIPDIRRVIHDELPASVIDYVQQSGRCGRDGKPAECILLLEPAELVRKASMAKHIRTEYSGRIFQQRKVLRQAWRPEKELLKLLFASPCIPAGIVRAFGKRGKACGCCSPCLHGAKWTGVPNLPQMQAWQIRAWLLKWQRDALAKKQKVRSCSIASTQTLNKAAKDLLFPVSVQVPEELERLLAYFRRNT